MNITQLKHNGQMFVEAFVGLIIFDESYSVSQKCYIRLSRIFTRCAGRSPRENTYDFKSNN